jgi:hypothetical protein
VGAGILQGPVLRVIGHVPLGRAGHGHVGRVARPICLPPQLIVVVGEIEPGAGGPDVLVHVHRRRGEAVVPRVGAVRRLVAVNRSGGVRSVRGFVVGVGTRVPQVEEGHHLAVLRPVVADVGHGLDAGARIELRVDGLLAHAGGVAVAEGDVGPAVQVVGVVDG